MRDYCLKYFILIHKLFSTQKVYLSPFLFSSKTTNVPVIASLTLFPTYTLYIICTSYLVLLFSHLLTLNSFSMILIHVPTNLILHSTTEWSEISYDNLFTIRVHFSKYFFTDTRSILLSIALPFLPVATQVFF